MVELREEDQTTIAHDLFNVLERLVNAVRTWLGNDSRHGC
jgi:hypothetical protein